MPHVRGTPYQMGYQQGALLRDDIREGVHYLFEVKGKEIKVELGGVKLLDPKRVISGIAAQQRKMCRADFQTFCAESPTGRGWTCKMSSSPTSFRSCFTVPGLPSPARPQKTVCSTTDGSSIMGATGGFRSTRTDGRPAGREDPFVIVTYAGFVGSVTGMNAEKVSIGEMGGKGMGHWDGVPMAFLMRMVLEEAPRSTRRSRSFMTIPGPANITS